MEEVLQLHKFLYRLLKKAYRVHNNKALFILFDSSMQKKRLNVYNSCQNMHNNGSLVLNILLMGMLKNSSLCMHIGIVCHSVSSSVNVYIFNPFVIMILIFLHTLACMVLL